MSLQEQDNTKKEWVKKIPKLDTCNKDSKKYNMEVIWDSTIYAKKLKEYLLDFYYPIV